MLIQDDKNEVVLGQGVGYGSRRTFTALPAVECRSADRAADARWSPWGACTLWQRATVMLGWCCILPVPQIHLLSGATGTNWRVVNVRVKISCSGVYPVPLPWATAVDSGTAR
jgi:hypothetical protein